MTTDNKKDDTVITMDIETDAEKKKNEELLETKETPVGDKNGKKEKSDFVEVKDDKKQPKRPGGQGGFRGSNYRGNYRGKNYRGNYRGNSRGGRGSYHVNQPRRRAGKNQAQRDLIHWRGRARQLEQRQTQQQEGRIYIASANNCVFKS